MTTIDETRIRHALQRSLDQELPPADAEDRILLRFRKTVADRGARAGAPPVNRRMLAGLLVAASLAIIGGTLAGAVALRNHGHPTGSPAKHPVVVTHAPAPTVSTSPAPTAANGAVTGFQPLSMTAVSEQEFWVLGTDGFCSSCSATILHTQDGGRTFSALPAPPFTFAHDSQSPEPTTVNDLRFADPMNGWAFGPSLWSTHDGGQHWQRLSGFQYLERLEPGGGGYVYAVTDSCGVPLNASVCTVQLHRARATGDAWSVVLQLSMPSGPPPSLGVHGDSVWLMNGAELYGSSDDGMSFAKLKGPCDAGLGGGISPVSATVLWGFCPTGTQGFPWRSTDSGRTVSTGAGAGTSVRGCSNGGMVAPLSASTAFVINCGASRLVETSDGGSSYHPVSAIAGNEAWWIGFTDPAVGYVIVPTADAMHSQLWRTSDSGAHWTQLRFSR